MIRTPTHKQTDPAKAPGSITPARTLGDQIARHSAHDKPILRMKPIEFVTDNGRDYNQPAGEFFEAIQKPLKIYSGLGQQMQILSYYYSEEDKCMVLDVEPK